MIRRDAILALAVRTRVSRLVLRAWSRPVCLLTDPSLDAEDARAAPSLAYRWTPAAPLLRECARPDPARGLRTDPDLLRDPVLDRSERSKRSLHKEMSGSEVAQASKPDGRGPSVLQARGSASFRTEPSRREPASPFRRQERRSRPSRRASLPSRVPRSPSRQCYCRTRRRSRCLPVPFCRPA